MPSETHIEARVKSLNAVLTEKHGQAVGKALRAANGDMPAALASLKGKLPAAALQKVALAHSLAVWSDDHVSLVKALSGQADITNLRDVALHFNVKKLAALVDSETVPANTVGAPDSYHPDDIGITHICNGVSVGPACAWKASCLPEFRQAKAEHFRGPTKICFFAMATDANGLPIIQGNVDPKPGYFVSTTALHQPGENVRTPQAQMDSNTVPFAVIPGTWQTSGKPGPRLGDFGVAYCRSNGKSAFFVIGDTGPRNKLGEGSVALHQALGNDPFMLRFGVRRARKGIGDRDVLYVVFPNSAQPNLRLDAASIERFASPLLDRFGGIERLKACAASVGN